MAADFEFGVFVFDKFDLVDFDFAGGGVEVFAGASELVSALTADFDGGVNGDFLLDFAGKMLESGPDLSGGGDFADVSEGAHVFRDVAVVEIVIGAGAPFGKLALWVASGGDVAEPEGGFVDFVEFEKFVGFFGHVASE